MVEPLPNIMKERKERKKRKEWKGHQGWEPQNSRTPAHPTLANHRSEKELSLLWIDKARAKDQGCDFIKGSFFFQWNSNEISWKKSISLNFISHLFVNNDYTLHFISFHFTELRSSFHFISFHRVVKWVLMKCFFINEAVREGAFWGTRERKVW
jgi:hypothetical protein